jgi:hypothetical protein
MNEIVIRIYDSANNILGDLELASFKDFPLVLTKGIVNLDNLKARTGTFSKTFKVPNTKNNSNLLVDVDNINSRKDYKDALGRKPCEILVNNAQVDKGFIQVGKVFDGFKLDSFELVFFGNNIDWVKDAADLKLNTVTYLNNLQTYNEAGINTANAATSDTYDHAYPYISRGGNEAGTTEVRDYYPVFYYKNLIIRGLNSLGWNVNSSFLDDVDIKRLVCDFSLKFFATDVQIADSKVRATKTTPLLTINYQDVTQIDYNDDSTYPNEDTGGNYDTALFQYTAPESATYDITAHISSRGTTAQNRIRQEVYVRLVVDGNVYRVLTFSPSTTVLDITAESVRFEGVALNVGQKASIFVEGDGPSITTSNYLDYEVIPTGFGGPSFETYLKVQRKSELVEGDEFNLNSVIPDDLKLLDVINDFTRMFNIYYWTDVKTRTIYFEPRDNFFKEPVDSINWTDKLDLDSGYEVDYISSYKRDVEFRYRDVGTDEWLTGWEEINKRTYAKYTYKLPERFGEGTDEVALSVFSAAYSKKAPNGTLSSDASGLDPVTIRIWNQREDSPVPTYRIEDYNPKVYLFNNGAQTTIGGASRYISQFGASQTTIPYGIFETYENVTSDINLSFTGSDGLFATYYSRMFKNIEEGGRLIANINLDSVDVENLDFRKLVYIAYPEQVAGYYILEKVIDFNPITTGLTKVSLFKFENLGTVPIDTGQEGNNDSDTDDGNTPTIPEPIYIEDTNGYLIEVAVPIPVSPGLELVYLK